jgi:hypothetical protein
MPPCGRGETPTKKSELSEERIADALQLDDVGSPLVRGCCEIGTPKVTSYGRNQKNSYLGVSALREQQMPVDENVRLRRIVGDLRGAERGELQSAYWGE